MIRSRLPLLSLSIVIVLAACAASTGAPTYTYAPTSSQLAAPSPAAPSASVAPASPPVVVAASASVGSVPTVTLGEWKVVVDGTIPSGKTAISIKNAGVVAHELLIFKSDLDPAAYPVDAAGDIKEKGARRSIRLHLIIGLVVVLVLAGGLGGWASTTEISGALIAPGAVVVDSNVK